MNKLKSLYIHICRVLLVMMFVLVPSKKAVAGGDNYTYYAKVTVYSTDTGAGTVYVDTEGREEVTKPSAGTTELSADISFEIHAKPNFGYKFSGWSETESGAPTDNNNPRTVIINSSSTNQSSPTSRVFYAHWQKSEITSITIKINGSNFGSGENVVFSVIDATTSNTIYTVPIKISSSAQISLKVPVGTYSVTPTSWAMNYTVTPVGSNTGVSVSTDTEFKFNVIGKSSTRAYDEKSKVNWGN